jgi:hypothetical protein
VDVTLRREVARAGRAMYRHSFSMRCVEHTETRGPAYRDKPCRDALCLPLSKGTSASGSRPSQRTQPRVLPGEERGPCSAAPTKAATASSCRTNLLDSEF